MGDVVGAITGPVGDILGVATDDLGLSTNIKPGKGSVVNRDAYYANDEEKALSEELKRRYLGDGPTVAQNALKAATDRNIANIAATAASQRGNQALVQREAMRAQAQAGQDSANQMAQLRANEMQNAGTSYTQEVQSQRTGRGEAEANAAGIGVQNDRNTIAVEQGNNKMLGGVLAGVGQVLASDENMKKNIVTVEGMATTNQSIGGAEVSDEKKKEERKKKLKETLASFQGDDDMTKAGKGAGEGIGKGVGVIAEMFSDERGKEDKKSTGSKNELYESFIDNIKAKTFEYKDPSAPGASEGKKLGVMAQDLEKSEIGKDMVINTPTGKMVDFAKAIAPTLAVVSTHNEELKRLKSILEKRQSKKTKSEE